VRLFFVIPLIMLIAFGQDAVFKTETRLVEVYATVHDQRGRYVDGLASQQFRVLDEGEVQPIVAFESQGSTLSCALVLDTTGSMQNTLPLVKNAAVSLIDEMRNGDSIAIYGFSTSLNLLQDFTEDRAAAKRALLRTRASGATALFDALAQVTRDVSKRQGKKVIVVFTDGADNASVLRAQSAITRAKKCGIPIYTVAEGEALQSKELLKQLRSIAEGSAGAFYEARKNADIGPIFRDILSSLQHTYMLTYKPPTVEGSTWRTIKLSVVGVADYRIRAKEGYFPE
jgi:Ca-activated chloride channel family protein